MKFPIGGIVRERSGAGSGIVRVRIWCDSKTDSIVWIEEDVHMRKVFFMLLRTFPCNVLNGCVKALFYI